MAIIKGDKLKKRIILYGFNKEEHQQKLNDFYKALQKRKKLEIICDEIVEARNKKDFKGLRSKVTEAYNMLGKECDEGEIREVSVIIYKNPLFP